MTSVVRAEFTCPDHRALALNGLNELVDRAARINRAIRVVPIEPTETGVA